MHGLVSKTIRKMIGKKKNKFQNNRGRGKWNNEKSRWIAVFPTQKAKKKKRELKKKWKKKSQRKTIETIKNKLVI